MADKHDGPAPDDGAVGSPAIARIDSRVVSYPLDPPFRDSIHVIPTVDCVVVELTTSDGIKGIGYCFAFGPDYAKVLKAMVDALGGLIKGWDPRSIGAIWKYLWHELMKVGRAGVGVSAMSAIDLALWDIAGKAAGMPLHRMLGSAGGPVRAYGSGGSLSTPIGELVEEVEKHVADGYDAVKIKIGLPDLAQDLERVAEVRRAIGPCTRLILDVNQKWTVKEAIELGRRFADYNIWWLEEPIPSILIEELRQVRDALPMEIATGETNFTPLDFDRLIQRGSADILMPNLHRAGGVTAWIEIAQAARLRGLSIASHVYPDINVQLIGAVTNGLTLEVIPWWPKLFQEVLRIEDGKAYPPQGPGLGLTFDEDIIARYRIG